MLTAIYATILLGVIIAPIPLLVIADKRQKRKALRTLMQQFSERGSEYGLAFSSQEVLPNAVLGLDGVQRKLLVFERRSEDQMETTVVSLQDVRSCTVRKYYRNIEQGSLSAHKLEEYLEKICLHFEMNSGQGRDILFYDHISNHFQQALELEQKARHWEAILSKMHGSLLKRA